jgi:hypothetical protein
VRRKSLLRAAAALIVAFLPIRARSLVIDTFESPQSVATGPSQPVGSVIPAPAGAIGVTRFVGASNSAPDGIVYSSIAYGSFGMSIDTPPDHGEATVAWDLGTPIDLSEGGLTRAFALHVSYETIPITLVVSVSSAAAGGPANGSSAAIALLGTGDYEIPLTAFVGSTPLTSVDRIALTLSGTASAPAGITLAGPFQTVPEPALAWAAGALGLLAVLRRVRVTREG